MGVRLFTVMLFVLGTQIIWSQENPDSLFRKAQTFVSVNDFRSALMICHELTEKYPENMDYAIYLGRIYSWNGDYQESITLLSGIHEKQPESYEALEALVNASLWSNNNEQTLRYAEEGLKAFPQQKLFFQNNKARALINLNKDAEALGLLDEMLAASPGNKDVLYMRTGILRKSKNLISLSYQNTSFSPSGTAPWHLGFLEYKRRQSDRLTMVYRVNYGYVFSRSGLLYEADFYPRISRRSYLYLNAGFSSGENVFPQVRGGAEYYLGFKKTAEASIGARYLKFKDQDVTMLTGQVSVSTKFWTFSYRPYLAFINKGSYWSNGISIKRYNEAKESFLQFDIQYGIVPYTFFFSNEINRTGTFRLGVQHQWRIKNHFFIKPMLLYEYEEFVPGQFRNRFNVQLTLSKRF